MELKIFGCALAHLGLPTLANASTFNSFNFEIYKVFLIILFICCRYVKTKDFHLYELGSIEKAEVPYVLESIIMKAESEKAKKHLKYKVYYSLPYSKFYELNTILHGHNLTFTIDYSSSFHISTEAMPRLKTNHKCLTFSNVQTWLHSSKNGVLNSSLSENFFSFFTDNFYECYSVIQDLNKQFGLVLIQVSKHLHA